MDKNLYIYKKIKKLISLVLSVVLLAPMVAIAAEEKDIQERAENSIGFLTNLGIIDNWETDEFVDRAEFINAIVRCISPDSGALNRNSDFKANKDVFVDVPTEHWASYNIEIAKDRGIIHGGEGGSFNPQGELSFDAAMKMAVSAAGYDILAEQNGGYPYGYTSTASEIGISEKVYCKDRTRLTKGEAACILRNMLDCYLIEIIYTDKDRAFTQNKDVKIINHVHKVYNFSGIIVGTPYSSFDSTKVMGDGTVKIKDVSTGNFGMFDMGKVDVQSLLGRRVEVYYVDEDVPTLVWTEFKSNQTVLRADGTEVDGVLSSEDKIQLLLKNEVNRFDTSQRGKRVKFEKDINIIKNGIFCSDVSSIIDILNNETDENIDYIEFYDNDKDGKYDVMNLVTYYTIYAEFVRDSDEELIVTDRFTGKRIEIDKKNDKNVVYRYDLNGREDNSTEIETGCLVSVSHGAGNVNLYKIRISDGKIKDSILQFEENLLSSENDTYTLSNTLFYSIRNGIISGPSYNVEYEFGVDYKGRIASYNLAVGGISDCFYIYDVKPYEDETKLRLKVFTLNGEHKEFICGEKFSVDSVKLRKVGAQYFISLLENHLVEYELDEDGEVTKIFFPQEFPDEGKLSYSLGMATTGSVALKYKGTPRVFYSDNVGSVGITANTKILHVPHETLVAQGLSGRDYCKIGAVGDFVNDSTYYVRAYQTTTSSVAADILVHYDKDESAITTATGVMVVGKVSRAINSEGELSTRISGMLRGTEKTVCSEGDTFVTANGTPVTIERGDIIKMGFNVYGDCDEVEMLYDHSEEYTDVTTSYSSTFRTIRGSVYSYDKDILYMVKNSWSISKRDVTPANLEAHICSSSAKIIIYDSDEKTLKLGSYLDLVGYRDDPGKYSRIVVANSYAVPNTIVIYK